MLTFQDHFLGIGDDQVEAGAVKHIERHASLVQEMEADIAIQPAHIFGRDNSRLIEGLNLPQCLQHGRIGSKDQGVMAIFGILGEFVGEDELIEDTGGHEDGFTGAHGQREDVVGIGTRIGLQVAINQFEGPFGRFLKHTWLGNVTEGFICANKATFRELSLPLGPLLEDLMHGFVVKKLLEKDVHLQRLELRLAQEGVSVGRAVEIKILPGEFTVVLAYMPTILDVELTQVEIEGKIILHRD